MRRDNIQFSLVFVYVYVRGTSVCVLKDVFDGGWQ